MELEAAIREGRSGYSTRVWVRANDSDYESKQQCPSGPIVVREAHGAVERRERPQWGGRDRECYRGRGANESDYGTK